MKKEKYGPEDTIVIGWHEEPSVDSTFHECHLCNRRVSVSIATMGDALANHAKFPGSKFWITCISCVDPQDAMPGGPMEGLLGELQKAELIKAGIDVEQVCKMTGKTIQELTVMMIERLQRAAKSGEKPGPLVDVADHPSAWSDATHDLPHAPGTWTPKLMWIRGMVEHLSESVEPEDDLMPMLLVDGTFIEGMPGVEPGDAGKRGIAVVMCAGDCMKNDETKDELATMMSRSAVALDAIGMTFISTCWVGMIPVKPEDDDPTETDQQREARMHAEVEAYKAKHGGKVSNDPNRTEKLFMMSIYEGGEDDGIKFVYADIKREEGKAPVPVDWKIAEGDFGFFGRFPEAIIKGLQAASLIRAMKAAMDNEGEEWKKGGDQ